MSTRRQLPFDASEFLNSVDFKKSVALATGVEPFLELSLPKPKLGLDSVVWYRADNTIQAGSTTMKPLTIGKVAERAGVGVETVRFYERKGLLDEPPRTASGYRQFDEGVIKRLEFISRAKELGFTLNEIKELLSLRVERRTCSANVRAKADAKIVDIESKISTLRGMKEALIRLTKACAEAESTGECPILEALDGRKPGRTR